MALSLGAVGHAVQAVNYTTAEAGNPIIDGWYADPDTEIYNDEYWIFPTYSADYDQQVFLDAFSSPDLITWTKHGNIVPNVSWVNEAMWAPAAIDRNGKYYIYFGANDIQSDDELGGIGVAVADQPEGPYLDPLGEPLIGSYQNGAQPIDQDVFIDDDGQAYMYYGGHSHANVVKLNEDMTSLGTFDDGTQFKEITPSAEYVEGPQMFKRNGTYYLMWSEGGWTGPDYAVSYGRSDSPTGPFSREAKILQQDSAIATGSGHNAVINVPDTDIWYIVYHRRPIGDDDGNHRQVCYDRMYFNDDGSIQTVTMLVKDNFDDGNTFGWTSHSGSWSVAEQALGSELVNEGIITLDTNFTDFVFDADVTIQPGTNGSDDASAGLVFRATLDSGNFNGYYAGISTTQGVVIGKSSAGDWQDLSTSDLAVEAGKQYHLRVSAISGALKLFVDDLDTERASVTDGSIAFGTDGVFVRNSGAQFDNVSVARP
jgi:hypothetical protein